MGVSFASIYPQVSHGQTRVSSRKREIQILAYAKMMIVSFHAFFAPFSFVVTNPAFRQSLASMQGSQKTDAEAKAAKRANAKAYALSLTAQIEKNAELGLNDENAPLQNEGVTESE